MDFCFSPEFIKQTNSNDTNENLIWHKDVLNLSKAHQINKGDSNVVIAVIDAVFNKNLTDLKNKWWVNKREIENDGIDNDSNGYIDDIHGWNFGDNFNDPFFFNKDSLLDKLFLFNHGTAVSTLVAGEENNSNSTLGACPGCKIMALNLQRVKLLDYRKIPEIENPYEAFVYAAHNGADIINFSMGRIADSSNAIESLIYDYCDSLGVILVTGSGNNFDEIFVDTFKHHYPSNDSRFISVGSVSNDLFKSRFSNSIISKVDLMAPGDKILTGGIYNSSYYNQFSGTSLSAPLISGILGLLKSQFPNKSKNEIIKTLLKSCNSIDYKNFEFSTLLGKGIPNAFAALMDTNLLRADFYTHKLDLLEQQDSMIKFHCVKFNFGKYIWIWGDGTTTVVDTNYVEKIYSTNGLFSIKLIAIDTISNYSDTILKSNWIKIEKYQRDRYSYDLNWVFGTNHRLFFAKNERKLDKSLHPSINVINSCISRLNLDSNYYFNCLFYNKSGSFVTDNSIGIGMHSVGYKYDTLKKDLALINNSVFYKSIFPVVNFGSNIRNKIGNFFPDFDSDSIVFCQAFSLERNYANQILKLYKIGKNGGLKQSSFKLFGDTNFVHCNNYGELIYQDYTICPNYDSNFYWLIVHPQDQQTFNKGTYLQLYKLRSYNNVLKADFFKNYFISDSIKNKNYYSMVFNKFGNRFAIQFDTFVEIYNFNNEFGAISKIRRINGNSNSFSHITRFKNLAFNDSGSILYGIQNSKDIGLFEIYQLNLKDSTNPRIIQRSWSDQYTQLENGPDGFIYIQNYFSDKLSAITQPNKVINQNFSNECGYINNALSLNTDRYLESKNQKSTSLLGINDHIFQNIPDLININTKIVACDSIQISTNFPQRIFKRWVINKLDTITGSNPIFHINSFDTIHIQMIVDGLNIEKKVNIKDSFSNYKIKIKPFHKGNIFIVDSAFLTNSITLDKNPFFKITDSIYWYYNDKIYVVGKYSDSFRFSKPGLYYGSAKNHCFSLSMGPINLKIPCVDSRYNTAFINSHMNLQTIPGLDTGVIKLDGSYIVQNGSVLELNNCSVLLTEGSNITIMPGGRLIANSVKFFSCGTWKGLKVLGIPTNGSNRNSSGLIHGSIVATNCMFTNAENAILSSNGGYLDVSHCVFDGNLHDVEISDYEYNHFSVLQNNKFKHCNANDSILKSSIYKFERNGKRNRYQVLLKSVKMITLLRNVMDNVVFDNFNSDSFLNINVINQATQNIMFMSDTLYLMNKCMAVFDTLGENNKFYNSYFKYGSLNKIDYRFVDNFVTALYFTNQDSLNCDRNLFEKIHSGIEFYQLDTNNNGNMIERNRFENCIIAVISSSRMNPLNKFTNNIQTNVNLNLNCNTFNYCDYCWVGTGKYPNQGNLTIPCGNLFLNIRKIPLLVNDHSRKYYFSAFNMNEYPYTKNAFEIKLDGILIDSFNYYMNTIEDKKIMAFSNCYSKRSSLKLKIDNANQKFEIKYYPNPITDFLNINLEFDCRYELNIFDLSGNLMIEKDLFGSNIVNLHNLSAGIYVCKIKIDGVNSYVFKIIKI